MDQQNGKEISVDSTQSAVMSIHRATKHNDLGYILSTRTESIREYQLNTKW